MVFAPPDAGELVLEELVVELLVQPNTATATIDRAAVAALADRLFNLSSCLTSFRLPNRRPFAGKIT